MTECFFITGTDTGIGKTYVTVELIKYFQARQHSVLAMKPISSGAAPTSEGLRNDDALKIQQALATPLPYDAINPLCFEAPIAPHLAAARAQQALEVEILLPYFNEMLAQQPDYLFIEGVGGWQVPLNESEMISDLVKAMDIPVIIVVGMKLGCINHTLLTVESILNQEVTIAGWIANIIDPAMESINENIAALTETVTAPLLATVDHGASIINLSDFCMSKNMDLFEE